MPRRTKILATLGPASSDRQTLARMIAAGMDGGPRNFPQGPPPGPAPPRELVPALAPKAGRAGGVLVDRQGPKTRTGKFQKGKTKFAVGNKFSLAGESNRGSANIAGWDYKNLP